MTTVGACDRVFYAILLARATGLWHEDELSMDCSEMKKMVRQGFNVVASLADRCAGG